MKTPLLIGATVVLAAAGIGVYLAQQGSSAPHKHQFEQRTSAAGEVYFTCAMHPEVRQDGPGNCPICGMPLIQGEEASAASEREPLYWYDPMRPEVHFDAPGRSPFMDMDLVPKYGEVTDNVIVTIDPRMAQNLGLRTAMVRRGDASRTLQAVGNVRIDERLRLTVESRTTGWIETLAVRAEGDPVKKGQVLATLYSPELLAAQREIALADSRGDARLAAAGRERLRLLAGGRDSSLRAPSDGVVTALMAREGAQLAPGMPLMQIADLSSVWITLDIPEAQAAALAVGQAAEARLSALPGEVFQGEVDYLYPELDTETRSLRARLAFDNADGRLRPGMFARVQLQLGSTGSQLRIPSEALIRTGRRSVVMVAEAAGRYRPVHVVPGEDLGAETVILEGLSEGQRVVVSGQFLIDSEASLLGAYRRLSPLDAAPSEDDPHDDHNGHEHPGQAVEAHPGHAAEAHPGHAAPHRGGEHGAMDHGGTPAASRPSATEEDSSEVDPHHEGHEGHEGDEAQHGAPR